MLRDQSIDAFRGLCVLLMIFVNDGGGGTRVFQHAPWDGFTLADLIFPWFVYLMGVSISCRSSARGSNLLGALFRSLRLFFIGLFIINKSTLVDELRIMGVLQRLAFCHMSVVAISRFEHRHQWIIVSTAALLWLVMTYALPVPGCPTGYTGPGGISGNGTHSHCIGGAATYIDQFILGVDHMYKWTVARRAFYPVQLANNTPVAFEPEGLLGTLNAIVTCFIGFKTGKSRPSVSLFAIACLSSHFIQANKQLWTLSFALISASSAQFMLYLAPTYDLLIACGRNSMLIYVGHTLLRGRLPFQWETNDSAQLLLQHTITIGFWCFIAAKADAKNWTAHFIGNPS